MALLGDNGAGKSTMIKAINGIHRLDGGELLFDGEPVTIRNAGDSRRLGIETVFQDLAVFDNLPARANFFVGRELCGPRGPRPLGLLRERAMTRAWDDHIRDLEVTSPTRRSRSVSCRAVSVRPSPSRARSRSRTGS